MVQLLFLKDVNSKNVTCRLKINLHKQDRSSYEIFFQRLDSALPLGDRFNCICIQKCTYTSLDSFKVCAVNLSLWKGSRQKIFRAIFRYHITHQYNIYGQLSWSECS